MLVGVETEHRSEQGVTKTIQWWATLEEFTITSDTQDFYNVSLVDEYNLPMMVDANGGSSSCSSTGCVADLNQ